jgi:hypothetical protein
MRFLFHLFNHNQVGARSLEDVLFIFGNQLRALGHWVLHDPENDRGRSRGRPDPTKRQILFAHGPDEINVIVEGFTDPVIQIVAEARQQLGARFLCLATEEPTAAGFNHGTQKEMVGRQEKFGAAMRYFDGILHLVPGARVTRWYSQFGVPAAQAELGFAPNLLRADAVREPKFDFGFYGSLTPRRLALLKRLRDYVAPSRHAVRIVADFATGAERDRAMQNAKVIVQVRKFEEMGLVSSSRCNTALCCGRPVVAEAHDEALSAPWDRIVHFTRSEDEFLLACKRARDVWRELHGQQFAEFMHRLTPEVCVGRALASLRLGERRARAA